MLLFLPKVVPQTEIYLFFYIHIYVCIIIYTNIFLKCAYLHTHKNISYSFCWQQSYIYCTYYRMHFLFFFLFILCTPIYPFFISFLCIHYHIYFCWQHLPALLLFSADGYIFFAFLFVCTFHISFLVFDIYFKFVFCILVLFIFFTSFLFFFCFSFVFLLFFYFLLFLWYI